MNTQRMPGIGSVARAQLELLVRTKYVVGLFGFFALMLLTTYAMLPRFEDLPPWEGPWIMILYVTLIGTGGLAGALVWFNEGARNRRYHWAMPVRREVHDILRIAAGLVWLIAMLAVMCVVAWLAEDAVTRDQWLRHAPLFWLSLFLVPILAYLLITIPCMMLGRPLLMILGVLTAALVMSMEGVGSAYPLLGDISAALFSHQDPPSLGVALGGGILTAPWSDPVEQKRVYNAVSANFWKEAGVHPNVKAAFDQNMNSAVLPPPVVTKREWLGSLALWYAIALLAIAFAVRRRPDV